MISVELIVADPKAQVSYMVKLEPGSTIDDVVKLASLDITPELGFAIFGKEACSSTVVKEGDRVEILRPLPYTANELRLARIKKNS